MILLLTSSCLLMQTKTGCKRSLQTVTSFSMPKMNWIPIPKAKMKYKSILQNHLTASLWFLNNQALRSDSLTATSMLTSISASSVSLWFTTQQIDKASPFSPLSSQSASRSTIKVMWITLIASKSGHRIKTSGSILSARNMILLSSRKYTLKVNQLNKTISCHRSMWLSTTSSSNVRLKWQLHQQTRNNLMLTWL